MKGLVSGLGLLVVAFTSGCGGSVVLVDTGDSRSVASCGGNCSSSQVEGSCASTCDKIARLNCPGTTPDTSCASHCAQASSMFPSCASASTDFLRCAESVQPSCGSTGTVFPGCEVQEQAVSDCVADAGPPTTVITSPPSGGSSSSGGTTSTCAPANVCPRIPRPAFTNGVACSGGGGGGPGGPVMSQSSCQDGSGNVWQASCVGTTCTCTFNGGSACTCTMSSAACLSCCPGTS